MHLILENAGTVLVGAVLLMMVVGIVRKLMRNVRRGKSACGCDCATCGANGFCHQKKTTD